MNEKVTARMQICRRFVSFYSTLKHRVEICPLILVDNFSVCVCLGYGAQLGATQDVLGKQDKTKKPRLPH